jgi:hypothetical protein
MREDWLTRDFWFLGIHMQNWMPIGIAICIAALAYGIWRDRSSGY